MISSYWRYIITAVWTTSFNSLKIYRGISVGLTSCLDWGFSWFSSVHSDHCRDIIVNRQRTPPSKSLPTHHSWTFHLIRLHTTSAVEKVSLNIPKLNRISSVLPISVTEVFTWFFPVSWGKCDYNWLKLATTTSFQLITTLLFMIVSNKTLCNISSWNTIVK